MRENLFIGILLTGTLLLSSASPGLAQDTTLNLWESTPPGRIGARGEEANTSDENSRKVAEKAVVRLGNVSTPTITLYPAPEEIRTGAAVLVCPGGGYNILAYDLEGTEVCEWLNSIGITGVLLKYRVPRPNGESRPIEALQDAQRALSLVRSKADSWKIDPERIGVLGFSAGGHLAARLSTNHTKRSYHRRDDIDDISCRPNFTLLIYPAYLFEADSDSLVSEDLPITEDMPPAFITMALDDPVDSENAIRFALAMKRAKASVALHLYPSGGHGYGLRRTEHAATTWPDRAAEWLSHSLDPQP